MMLIQTQKLITIKRIAFVIALIVIYESQLIIRNSLSSVSSSLPSFISIAISSGPNGEYRVLRPHCNCTAGADFDEDEHILIEKLNPAETMTNQTRLVVNLVKYVSFWTRRVVSKSQLMETSLDELRREEIACDMYNVLKRGKNQRVVSYSLYGNQSMYIKNFECISQIVKVRYPGFNVRIHYDNSVDERFRCQLECKHPDMVDFCDMNRFGANMASQLEGEPRAMRDLGFMNKMMWRFLPVGDTFVNVFMSRDSDTLFIDREIDSVYYWLNNTSHYGHIMRDHPAHGVEILGGMWGLRTHLDRKRSKKIFDNVHSEEVGRKYNANGQTPKGDDQFFLSKYVWGLVKDDATIHDSYTCRSFANSKPFPTQRCPQEDFIGAGVPVTNMDQCPLKYHQAAARGQAGNMTYWSEVYVKRTVDICPKHCRPAEHKDWIYC